MQTQNSHQDTSPGRNAGRRPPAVTIAAWLFIIAGTFGLIYHSRELFANDKLMVEVVWVLILRVLAIVCGLLLLRGVNRARWLALSWLAYHVVLSTMHSVSETLIHIILLLVVAYLLYRQNSSAYFRK